MTSNLIEIENVVANAYFDAETKEAREAINEIAIADHGTDENPNRVAVLGDWKPFQGESLSDRNRYNGSDTTMLDLAEKLVNLGAVLKTPATHQFNQNKKILERKA